MAKVHPGVAKPRSLETEPTCHLSPKQETFTIWMKSLVLSGKGCTVFDSNGRIVYRVDSYNQRCINQVHLMDFKGKLLFTILKKSFWLFGCWEGYRSTASPSSSSRTKFDEPGADFRVRKGFKLLGSGDSPCKVRVNNENQVPSQCCYKIQASTSSVNNSSSSTCKILDNFSGALIAEVKRKKSASGVVLGEDVLTIVVEPCIDHSLVVAIVIVFNLMNSKI